ncbi:hypothetical protein GCM10012280_71170 [Wenjunlia tyrosinilytica]|uniref:Uncharacterized protein n=1 Tax=Wenjunlia tyrosinilytica TaxID=1544741 RepID=A0A917ZZ04_9ACTN|nr:hypothetical protein GCM10012280_71170 [Wenjunlia tyrosinilytica]
MSSDSVEPGNPVESGPRDAVDGSPEEPAENASTPDTPPATQDLPPRRPRWTWMFGGRPAARPDTFREGPPA